MQTITTKEIVCLKDAKAFGFIVESPKLDSVKAATVQQRLVNRQLWPSQKFCTVQSLVTQQTTDC